MFWRLAEASLTEEIGRIESWGSDVTRYKLFEQEALVVPYETIRVQCFARTASLFWHCCMVPHGKVKGVLLAVDGLEVRLEFASVSCKYGPPYGSQSYTIVPQSHWQWRPWSSVCGTFCRDLLRQRPNWSISWRSLVLNFLSLPGWVQIWWFPKIGVPLIIIHVLWIFPYERSSYWGTPHLWKPSYQIYDIYGTRNPGSIFWPRKTKSASKCFFLPRPKSAKKAKAVDAKAGKQIGIASG